MPAADRSDSGHLRRNNAGNTVRADTRDTRPHFLGDSPGVYGPLTLWARLPLPTVSDVTGPRSLAGSPSPTGPPGPTGVGGPWPEPPGVYVHATVPDLALPDLALPGMPAPANGMAADQADHTDASMPTMGPRDGAEPADWEDPPAVAEPTRSEETLWPDWPDGPEEVARPDAMAEWARSGGIATPEAPSAPDGPFDAVSWSASAAAEEPAYEDYAYAHEGVYDDDYEGYSGSNAGGSESYTEPEFPPVPLPAAGTGGSIEPASPGSRWDSRAVPAIARGDLIAELAGRLEQLDQLLGRLEEAERQAADASEHLLLTRRWQEETVRTIQEERARMRQRQHALDELAERARAAVEAMQATYRTLPREVIELAIELQVLDRAGFVTKRAPKQRPEQP